MLDHPTGCDFLAGSSTLDQTGARSGEAEACHEVGGYYMAAVGTLYAVVLGMAVSEASSKYDDARHFLESENNSLLEV